MAILSEASPDAAHDVADCIRVAVEGLEIEHTGSPTGYVTVSIGVATASPMIGSVGSELLQLADQALYAAKRDGRNSVHSMAATCDDDSRLSFEHIVALGTGPQRSQAAG